MYEDLILEWNPWWNENYTWEGVSRVQFKNIEKNLKNDLILSFIGVRRSGKTQLLYQTIDYLLKNNISKSDCFFIKIDDIRIKDKLSLELIYNLLELRESLFGKSKKLYLFLDEIQEMDNWQLALKTIYDLNKSKIKIFITGSNASLLKQELSDYLTGRKLDLEIYPFSFSEFISAISNVKIQNKIDLISNKIKIKKLFNDYVSFSGFPEIVFNRELAVDYIRNLHETIVLKDVVTRYKLQNSSKILDVSRYILTNCSKPFNFLKISNTLEISKDSFSLYINYFEDVFLYFKLYLFDYSLKKQLINEKKIYSVDLGFLNYSAFKFSEDKGRILENLVFIELKRRNNEIYYHKDKNECDFLIKKDLNITQAIQVTKSLDDFDVKQREFAGLIEACKKYKLNYGLILTDDQEFTQKGDDGIEIRVLPIWKWLLSEF